MKLVFLLVSVLAVLAGSLWMGQGMGYIQWPHSSFMINQKQWTLYGSVLLLAGLFGLWISRR